MLNSNGIYPHSKPWEHRTKPLREPLVSPVDSVPLFTNTFGPRSDTAVLCLSAASPWLVSTRDNADRPSKPQAWRWGIMLSGHGRWPALFSCGHHPQSAHVNKAWWSSERPLERAEVQNATDSEQLIGTFDHRREISLPPNIPLGWKRSWHRHACRPAPGCGTGPAGPQPH